MAKAQLSAAIDVEAFTAQVKAMVGEAVSRTAYIALHSAVERAPVRKVFKGGRRSGSRALTSAERKSTIRLLQSQRQALRARGFTPGSYASGIRVQVGRNRANLLQTTRKNRQVSFRNGRFELTDIGSERFLTSRGRYELRSGRALVAIGEQRSAGRGLSETQFRAIREAASSGSAGQLGGSLRNSIHSEKRDRGKKIKTSIVAGGEEAPYARFVEFGTRHAAAQPFLRPALKHAEQVFPALMREALKNGLRRRA